MENGDVKNFLQNHADADRPLLVRSIRILGKKTVKLMRAQVADVGSGVAYLHENDIIHGDIKGVGFFLLQLNHG